MGLVSVKTEFDTSYDKFIDKSRSKHKRIHHDIVVLIPQQYFRGRKRCDTSDFNMVTWVKNKPAENASFHLFSKFETE